MKNIKIVFQGDSVTDAMRDRSDCHNMGTGYPKYASEMLTKYNPDISFEFINMGISGNRSSQLFDRLYTDALIFEPDIISVLIGVNDVWHRYDTTRIMTTDAQYALNYRSILERIKRESNAKIVMLEPFILDAEDKQYLKPELAPLQSIVKELADEFADAYIPLNSLFADAIKAQPTPFYYSDDGVHPNANGAELIGKAYADAVNKILKEINI